MTRSPEGICSCHTEKSMRKQKNTQTLTLHTIAHWYRPWQVPGSPCQGPDLSEEYLSNCYTQTMLVDGWHFTTRNNTIKFTSSWTVTYRGFEFIHRISRLEKLWCRRDRISNNSWACKRMVVYFLQAPISLCRNLTAFVHLCLGQSGTYNYVAGFGMERRLCHNIVMRRAIFYALCFIFLLLQWVI